MIVGIIKKEERILGCCSIEERAIYSNKTKTVICNNIEATSKDKIIFLCDTCKKESVMGKRAFFDNNNNECICRNCRVIRTSLDRYGIESPNKVGRIKEAQHLRHKARTSKFEDGNSYQLNKTSSFEELCELRKHNAKKKWKNGDYDKTDFSTPNKLKWADRDYREKMLDIFGSSEYKKRKSKSLAVLESNKKSKERLIRKWKEMPDKMLETVISNLCGSGSGNGRFSKLHQKFLKKLNLRDIGFIGEQRIGRYFVDELNPNSKTVIEINGDYVHANPKIFKAGDIIRLPGNSYTAEEKWESDAMKIRNLSEMGYKVIVVWESDELDEIKQKYPEIFI